MSDNKNWFQGKPRQGAHWGKRGGKARCGVRIREDAIVPENASWNCVRCRGFLKAFGDRDE